MPVSCPTPLPTSSHSPRQSTTSTISATTHGHITIKVISFPIGERFELCTPCFLLLKVLDIRISSSLVIITSRPPSDIPTVGTLLIRSSRMLMIWRPSGRTSRMIFSGEVRRPVEEVVLPVSSPSTSDTGEQIQRSILGEELIPD